MDTSLTGETNRTLEEIEGRETRDVSQNESSSRDDEEQDEEQNNVIQTEEHEGTQPVIEEPEDEDEEHGRTHIREQNEHERTLLLIKDLENGFYAGEHGRTSVLIEELGDETYDEEEHERTQPLIEEPEEEVGNEEHERMQLLIEEQEDEVNTEERRTQSDAGKSDVCLSEEHGRTKIFIVEHGDHAVAQTEEHLGAQNKVEPREVGSHTEEQRRTQVGSHKRKENDERTHVKEEQVVKVQRKTQMSIGKLENEVMKEEHRRTQVNTREHRESEDTNQKGSEEERKEHDEQGRTQDPTGEQRGTDHKDREQGRTEKKDQEEQRKSKPPIRYRKFIAMSLGKRLRSQPIIHGRITCLQKSYMLFEIIPSTELRNLIHQEWIVSAYVREGVCPQHQRLSEEIVASILMGMSEFTTCGPAVRLREFCPGWPMEEGNPHQTNLYAIELKSFYNDKETYFGVRVTNNLVMTGSRLLVFSYEHRLLYQIAVDICKNLYKDFVKN